MEGDGCGSFFLKSNFNSNTASLDSQSTRSAKYSIALQYLVFEGISADAEQWCFACMWVIFGAFGRLNMKTVVDLYLLIVVKLMFKLQGAKVCPIMFVFPFPRARTPLLPKLPPLPIM